MGFKRTGSDLSFSSEAHRDLERQVFFISILEPGMHNGRVAFPGLWTDRRPLPWDLQKGCVQARWASGVPR